ncbi:glycosyl transferase family 1, partial [Staphylococcus aureus]|nr:glycosyl transferase family 1 [Staphylococcus aureus]
QDIQEMYPIENERFELIPHFIELNHRKGENEVIQEDRFIYIGRFSSEKQMDHLIKAYDKFVKSGHQTKLHLFGRDEDN